MIGLKKAVVLACVAAYSLVRGRARRRPAHPKKVLVIQMAKLGDMVCTTPLFRAVKQHDESCAVYVLGSARNEETLAYHPHVDGYLVFDGFLSVIPRIRKEAFDAAVIAGAPDFFSAAAAFFAGLPLIVVPRVVNGYSPFDDLPHRLIASFMTTAPHAMGSYGAGEYLRLLEPVGIHATDTTKRLQCSEEAKARVAARLRKQGLDQALLVGITPTTGSKIKQWPAERFAAVADYLIERHGAHVCILGGPTDYEEVGQMKAGIKHSDQAIDFTGTLSIDELKAFMSHLALFVSADTGPIYVAEAYGVPTVDILGPILAEEIGPRGPQHILLTPPYPREPQLRLMNPHGYDVAEAQRQLASISVDTVNAACSELLTRWQKTT